MDRWLSGQGVLLSKDEDLHFGLRVHTHSRVSKCVLVTPVKPRCEARTSMELAAHELSSRLSKRPCLKVMK